MLYYEHYFANEGHNQTVNLKSIRDYESTEENPECHTAVW